MAAPEAESILTDGGGGNPMTVTERLEMTNQSEPTRQTARITKKTAALALCGLLMAGAQLGCGGEEAASPSPAKSQARAKAKPSAAANAAPEISDLTIRPRSPMSGGMAKAEVDAFDKNGDTLSYAYEWLLDGDRIGSGEAGVNLKNAQRGDELELRVIVSDGHSEVSESVRVDIGNAAPQLLGVRVSSFSSQELTALPNATDLDGDAVTFSYRWMVNDTFTGETDPEISTAGLRTGDIVQVSVMASDGDDESIEVTSPPYPLGNNPPVFVSKPSEIQVIDDRRLFYEVRADDPDGHSVRYRLEAGPEGMEVDNLLGELSWVPLENQSGEYAVEIVADDLNGGLTSQSFTVGASED